MRNIKLTIEYDGTHYCGWQTQTSRKPSVLSLKLRTIQETLERSLQKILQEKVVLIGSGRTDAGVHAIAQVANFKTARLMPAERLKGALNAVLPKDIAVKKVEEAPLRFHSRFDAQAKRYVYHILQADTKTAFGAARIWHVREPLDIATMRREAKSLLGRHDFKSFQAQDRLERNSRTMIKEIVIKKHKLPGEVFYLSGDCIITIAIEASGFLRNMARNIVGTLVDAGRGKIKKGAVRKILSKRDRKSAGVCAPARGLCLLEVKYE